MFGAAVVAGLDGRVDTVVRGDAGAEHAVLHTVTPTSNAAKLARLPDIAPRVELVVQ
jgi:hypothetical protein